MLSIYLTLISSPSDKEKFTAIYYAYKDKMYAVAMSVLHNASLSEEAVQESFFKIATKIFLFSDVSCRKTASLIVIIVRNTSIDILRKERQGTFEPLDESADYSEHLALPDVRDILDGGTSELLLVIDSLDSLYSDALKLKYLYGYSNSEISGLLGISEKCAESRVYRARAMLKSRLEEMGYEVE